MKYLRWVVMAFLLSGCASTYDLYESDISEQWSFKKGAGQEWLPAKIPGTLHTDLMHNGIIGDPFYGMNESHIQWIDKEDWEYKCEFTADGNILAKDNLELVFGGLDTYADVYLNGRSILSADNMFREWRANVKEYMVAGKNELKLYFKSPFKHNYEKSLSLPYKLLSVRANDQCDTMVGMYSRKAGYHWGWDWGPRLVTSGIWRPVKLEGWNKLKMNSIHYVQKELSKEKAVISVVLNVTGSVDEVTDLVVENETKDEKIIFPDVKIIKGKNEITRDFIVSNPELWWCNGLGEPHLYKFRTTLKSGSEILAEDTRSIGIRQLRVVREKDPGGASFYVELNGRPVFMKGANYIPMDNFLPRVDTARYEKLIKSAADANMNMIRVWGGGIYENDIFYDLCDKYGILIWQDFMFACNMYPADEEFAQNVKAEATGNVVRLRNHPSIALWCGSNEIYEGWHYWNGWKNGHSPSEKEEMWKGYKRIFQEILPAVIAELDSGRLYWESSPVADFNTPSNYNSGDVHFWDVWWGENDFTHFEKNVGRFMSEYGFQSMPSMNSVRKFSQKEDWNVYSPVMLQHQRALSSGKRAKEFGYDRIASIMKLYYKIPDDFSSFVYISQLLQAEGMKTAIETHRRNMPYCMGSLYWQLNDCWPVTSWAGIDYYGEWKALHYAAKKSFNNEIICFREIRDSLEVYLVNDGNRLPKGELILVLFNMNGEVISSAKDSVTAGANSSSLINRISIPALLNNNEKSDLLLSAKLIINGKILTDNIHYFVRPKDLKLQNPGLTYTLNKTEYGYEMEISAKRPARNIYIHAEGTDLDLDRNYFDLLPGERKSIRIETAEANLKDNIKVITLYDIYNRN